MLPETGEPESKAKRVIREFEESLPPSLRGRYDVMVVKDKTDLTKWRLWIKIPERDDGGTGEST